jgi:predicted nuclease of predicted toxin-antitoxin system
VRLVADENVHGKVIRRLRASGYEVESIKETDKGALDPDILARPDLRTAVLITNDRDYGDLVFRRGLPPPQAILYTRTPHRDWLLTSDLLLRELARGVRLHHMTTIASGGVRYKPFIPGVPDG